METFVCIHGHFYQPPRENPWFEAIERQGSAYPFHDWNERIEHECYAPNTTARILDGEGYITRIANNFSRMSFNVGPTLMAWIEWADPETYEAIIAADGESRGWFSGHGSAIAQAYNHMILPLANSRDKRTQIVWGLHDFRSRFGRDAEGMWLAETAVDLESLDIMVELGVKWTILAPRQASKVRPRSGGDWEDVSNERVDPSRAYEVALPSGRRIAVFFYDGPVSRAVAFERLLDRGENLADRLVKTASDKRTWPQLLHIATDGETYGHHHRHGEMALAYALQHIQTHGLAKLTNYSEFLEKHPPTHEAQIFENSSWSCVHGVERWRSDCGCNSGMHPAWRQGWRAPLREALDFVRDRLVEVFERRAHELLKEPWAAREAYIGVILDRSPESVDRFFAAHQARALSDDERTTALRLLEAQRHAMLMYTSCGWFFDDLAGIETVQVMRYAARAIRLARDLGAEDPEPGFLERLEKGRSNVPEQGDGRRIYERHAKTCAVGLQEVCAHYAVSSLFEDYADEARVYCYRVQRRDFVIDDAGRTRLLLGRARVTSEITLESGEMTFGALHLGDHNINGGVRESKGDDAWEEFQRDARKAFSGADFAAVLGVFHRHFGEATYTLGSLFSDEQQNVVDRVLEARLEEIERDYRRVYEFNAPVMRFLSTIGAQQPLEFEIAARYVLNKSLRRALESDEPDPEQVRALLEQAQEKGISLDKEGLAYAFEERLERFASAIEENGEDRALIERIEEAVRLAHELPFGVDLWTMQKAYYRVHGSVQQEMLARTTGERADEAGAWLERFGALGDALRFRIK